MSLMALLGGSRAWHFLLTVASFTATMVVVMMVMIVVISFILLFRVTSTLKSKTCPLQSLR